MTHSVSYVQRETTSVPDIEVVIYPPTPAEQELRNLKRRLIEIRRGQLSLVKQIEELIEAADAALLRY